MAQYIFFMILSLGLFFATPKSSSNSSTKKANKSLRIFKTGGGDTWSGGGK